MMMILKRLREMESNFMLGITRIIKTITNLIHREEVIFNIQNKVI